jgi:hypothetical protein
MGTTKRPSATEMSHRKMKGLDMPRTKSKRKTKSAVGSGELVRLLDHCEAILRALSYEPVPSSDMKICALDRANRCRDMAALLKQSNA